MDAGCDAVMENLNSMGLENAGAIVALTGASIAVIWVDCSDGYARLEASTRAIQDAQCANQKDCCRGNRGGAPRSRERAGENLN
jgi:hypothetical protein